MQKFDEWYGPYPYKQITLIDPEPDSAVGGMEYPTLITGGTDWWEPSWYHFGMDSHGGPRVRPSVLVWHGRQQ